MQRLQRRRLVRNLPIMLCWAAAVACPQAADIWIAPSSTASHLVLQLGHKRGHPGDVVAGSLIVVDCAHTTGPIPDSVAVWSIRHPRTATLSRFVYGELPDGFETRHSPQPLIPGCYVAEAGGVGHVKFLINEDRSISDAGRSW
jgi:hypothetical protein